MEAPLLSRISPEFRGLCSHSLRLLWFFTFVIADPFTHRNCAENLDGLEHVQTKYCKAHFVIKATVKGLANQSDPGTVGWIPLQISIKSQIKIGKAFIDLSDAAISTLWLQPTLPTADVFAFGQKYLISGRLKGGRLVVDPCKEWIQVWSSVSNRHRSSLRKAKFERGCFCSVDLEVGSGAKRKEGGCSVWDSTPAVDVGAEEGTRISKCYNDHAHCVQRTDSTHTRCNWNKNRELRACLSDISPTT